MKFNEAQWSKMKLWNILAPHSRRRAPALAATRRRRRRLALTPSQNDRSDPKLCPFHMLVYAIAPRGLSVVTMKLPRQRGPCHCDLIYAKIALRRHKDVHAISGD